MLADRYQCFLQVYTKIWVCVARHTQNAQDTKLKEVNEEVKFLYADIKVFYLLTLSFFYESRHEYPKYSK